VSKACLRVRALGDVDELNSFLGLLAVEVTETAVQVFLRSLQQDLFDLGAGLASPQGPPADAGRVVALEQHLAAMNAKLPPLREFVLPGGNRAAALCHVARAVCRRAERTVVAVAEAEPSPALGDARRYLNRLSDLLFVLSRMLYREGCEDEIQWNKGRIPGADGE
jgi:cob(I)alamin adenosyltransferase